MRPDGVDGVLAVVLDEDCDEKGEAVGEGAEVDLGVDVGFDVDVGDADLLSLPGL